MFTSNADEHRECILNELSESYNGKTVTTDFSESGFIFPDGTLPRMGIDGMRAEDHSIVMHLYDDISYANSQTPKSDAMCRFINEGNIRYLLSTDKSGQTVNIELGISNEPTLDQYKKLAELVKASEYVRIDFTGTDGNCVESLEYPIVIPSKILTGIRVVYRKRLRTPVETGFSSIDSIGTKTLCRSCSDWECRCSNCVCLTDKGGLGYCDQYQKYCRDVKECGEFSIQMGCNKNFKEEKAC